MRTFPSVKNIIYVGDKLDTGLFYPTYLLSDTSTKPKENYDDKKKVLICIFIVTVCTNLLAG